MASFGVAGYPPAFHKSEYKRDRIKILNWISELGLNAFEIQMTYGPKTKEETCRNYRSLANELNIKISIHGSYFIVLTSSDKTKIRRSLDTLKRTFELASVLDSDVVVIHPGSLYGENSDGPLNRLKENLTLFFNEVGKSDIGLFLETAGKRGQLGSVDEVLSVAIEVDSCYPCIDFGHVHARTLGSLDNEMAIEQLIKKLVLYNASNKMPRIHFHYTPILFGAGGEISHKALNDRIPNDPQLGLEFDNDFKLIPGELYKPRPEHIMKHLLELDDFTIISETYNSQEEGALLLKNLYHQYLGDNG